MKNGIVLSALLCLVSVSALAQKKYYTYCDICVYGDNKSPMKKFTELSFDFGKRKDADLLDEDGNVLNFTSYIEAVNYLARYGWELKDTYTEYGYVDILHCVMSKQVSDDDEITEGLRLKYYVKEKKPREAVAPIVGADGKRKIVLSKRREAYTGSAEGEK